MLMWWKIKNKGGDLKVKHKITFVTGEVVETNKTDIIDKIIYQLSGGSPKHKTVLIENTVYNVEHVLKIEGGFPRV